MTRRPATMRGGGGAATLPLHMEPSHHLEGAPPSGMTTSTTLDLTGKARCERARPATAVRDTGLAWPYLPAAARVGGVEEKALRCGSSVSPVSPLVATRGLGGRRLIEIVGLVMAFP